MVSVNQEATQTSTGAVVVKVAETTKEAHHSTLEALALLGMLALAVELEFCEKCLTNICLLIIITLESPRYL